MLCNQSRIQYNNQSSTGLVGYFAQITNNFDLSSAIDYIVNIASKVERIRNRCINNVRIITDIIDDPKLTFLQALPVSLGNQHILNFLKEIILFLIE